MSPPEKYLPAHASLPVVKEFEHAFACYGPGLSLAECNQRRSGGPPCRCACHIHPDLFAEVPQ